jgi:glycerate kinase
MNRQSMRLVVAPDKFNGSLAAVEAPRLLRSWGWATGASPKRRAQFRAAA